MMLDYDALRDPTTAGDPGIFSAAERRWGRRRARQSYGLDALYPPLAGAPMPPSGSMQSGFTWRKGRTRESNPLAPSLRGNERSGLQ